MSVIASIVCDATATGKSATCARVATNALSALP
jgi:hypothetical protein